MRTTSTNDKIYLGKQAGIEIFKEIKNAKKSVKIVSPYLSPAYVQELIKLNAKGKNITLITADNITNSTSAYSDFKASDLVKTDKIFDENLERKRKVGILFSLGVVLLSSIIFSMSFSIFSLFYFSIVLFFVSMISLSYFYLIKSYKIVYNSLFKIKVFDSKSGDKPWSTKLVHSKIFIIDDIICFLGSANFTYSGFETHYETVIKVEDFNAIKDISDEIERLYNSNDFRVKGVEEWMI